jgi:hypothetical protein
VTPNISLQNRKELGLFFDEVIEGASFILPPQSHITNK